MGPLAGAGVPARAGWHGRSFAAPDLAAAEWVSAWRSSSASGRPPVGPWLL